MNFVKQHFRSVSMVITLIIIWCAFTAMTGGVFLEARNLSNLFLQMAVIAILAVGMVLIIVSGNIDLSVGSIVGVTGAFAALVQVNWLGPVLFSALPGSSPDTVSNLIALAAILAALLLGAFIGFSQGWLVAHGRVPAFIVTLAGMLILRGAILGITGGVTVSPMEPLFRLLGQGYISASSGIIMATVISLFLIIYLIMHRRERAQYGLEVPPVLMFALELFLICAGIFFFVIVMNQYRGVGIPVLILLVLAALVAFIGRNTPFGRYIYAIGGNEQAARLSGIAIPRVLILNFTLMGVLAAVSGIVLTARLDAATMNAGGMFELSAIAACVIGGCSLSGGAGSIWGALVGALLMASLDNGMSLMNVEAFWQQIVKGLVLLVAVYIDGRFKVGRQSPSSEASSGAA